MTVFRHRTVCVPECLNDIEERFVLFHFCFIQLSMSMWYQYVIVLAIIICLSEKFC